MPSLAERAAARLPPLGSSPITGGVGGPPLPLPIAAARSNRTPMSVYAVTVLCIATVAAVGFGTLALKAPIVRLDAKLDAVSRQLSDDIGQLRAETSEMASGLQQPSAILIAPPAAPLATAPSVQPVLPVVILRPR